MGPRRLKSTASHVCPVSTFPAYISPYITLWICVFCSEVTFYEVDVNKLYGCDFALCWRRLDRHQPTSPYWNHSWWRNSSSVLGEDLKGVRGWWGRLRDLSINYIENIKLLSCDSKPGLVVAKMFCLLWILSAPSQLVGFRKWSSSILVCGPIHPMNLNPAQRCTRQTNRKDLQDLAWCFSNI